MKKLEKFFELDKTKIILEKDSSILTKEDILKTYIILSESPEKKYCEILKYLDSEILKKISIPKNFTPIS